jgi:hypothetical protein
MFPLCRSSGRLSCVCAGTGSQAWSTTQISCLTSSKRNSRQSPSPAVNEEQAFLLSAHVTSLTSSQAPSCAKDYLTPVSSVCAGGHAAIRRRFVPVVLPGLRLALLLFHREELGKWFNCQGIKRIKPRLSIHTTLYRCALILENSILSRCPPGFKSGPMRLAAFREFL